MKVEAGEGEEALSHTLEWLDALIAFPSVSSESNLPVIDFLTRHLSGLGFDLHRIGDPTGTKAGLLASIGPRDRPGILLSGHTDVVPVAGQDWSSDPFRLRRDDGRVYGRGSADMKGFLACMLQAAELASKAELTEPLKLAFSWDEELGCLGIPHMLPKLDETIGKPHLCIVGEPTEMRIMLGHKGKSFLKAVCHGTTGHSAMAPQFANAIHLVTEFVTALRALQADIAANGYRDPAYDIPYTTVHAARIAAGTALNIVPDRAVLDFEFRYPAGEDPRTIDAAIDAAAREITARWRAQHPEAGIEIETVNAYPGLGTAADHEAVALMHRFLASEANGASYGKVAYGTEGGYFASAGIPSIVCGPGSMDQGHKPDEFIALSELAACNAMSRRLVDWLSR
ncbi:MAG: acetylornithine deacetylase [Nitratireductor sp.]|nr:acetylornithine deacetylase [Nitratireductor sp.]